MSVQTIKGSRQKITTGSYGNYIPFGADGEYIDMRSGLNLERQLKLGGDHSATISENEYGNTVITEIYADQNSTNNYYKVITTIAQNGAITNITSQLHWINSQADDILKNTKNTTIDESSDITDITEVLS